MIGRVLMTPRLPGTTGTVPYYIHTIERRRGGTVSNKSPPLNTVCTYLARGSKRPVRHVSLRGRRVKFYRDTKQLDAKQGHRKDLSTTTYTKYYHKQTLHRLTLSSLECYFSNVNTSKSKIPNRISPLQELRCCHQIYERMI